MNIAVFGWYHHRNTGDDRIQHGITRWLDGHTLAFLPAGRQPPLQLLRTYDAAIIGGGGLIMSEGGMFQHMAGWVRAAGIPVALVGVSVERLTPRLRDELRAFLEVCCFAWFRDQGSLDAIGAHPRAFVAPDLTWLYPFAPLAPAAGGVALCLRKREGFPIARWRAEVARLGEPILPWPLYFEQGGDAAVLQQICPPEALPEEFSLEALRAARVVIAGRYHAVQFAIQCGRPFVGVGEQPKIRRFLQEHGLGGLLIAEDEPERLGQALQSIDQRYDELACRVLALRGALHEQALAAGQRARDMLLDAAAALPPPSRRWRSRMRAILQ